MFNFKSKKIILASYFCVLSTLLFPALTQAELGGSGSKAANQAEEQRAAIAKRKERKEKEAEAKKAAETQQAQPTETQQPQETEPEQPADQ